MNGKLKIARCYGKWQPDMPYVVDSVCDWGPFAGYGERKYFVCKENHISSADTEPLRGPNWADKWSELVIR